MGIIAVHHEAVRDVLLLAEVVPLVVGGIKVHSRQGLHEGVTHVSLHPPGDIAPLLTIHGGEKVICGSSVLQKDHA